MMALVLIISFVVAFYITYRSVGEEKRQRNRTKRALRIRQMEVELGMEPSSSLFLDDRSIIIPRSTSQFGKPPYVWMEGDPPPMMIDHSIKQEWPGNLGFSRRRPRA